MARGHIRLGLPGALRDYMLIDPKARSKQLANPMAVKLGSGLGNYDDMQNFAGWVMESWEAGISKREADAGGTLYSELDTRFPNQVILPPNYTFLNIPFTTGDPSEAQFINNNVTVLTIGGTGGTYSQMAMRATINTPASATNRVLIPIYGNAGISVTVTLYADDGGDEWTNNPTSGTNWGSATATLDGELGLNWYTFNIVEQSIANGTKFWIVIKPTTASQTFTMPTQQQNPFSPKSKKYNGSTWSPELYMPFFFTVQHSGSTATSNIDKIDIYASSGGKPPAAWLAGDGFISRNTAPNMERINHTVGDVVDICAFGDVLWVARSGSTDAATYTLTGDTFTVKTGITANLFARWAGYLWRAYLNDVWYTVDGSTWFGPFQIGPDGYEVRGMAGLGDDMYVATDEGLYRVGAGDKVYGVTRWNQISSSNGVGMIHHQGAIYIPVGLDLFQFNGSQVLPIGLNREEGLPQYKQGRVVSLCSHNYWLIAMVRSSTATTGWSTVWAWNQQGWHYLITLPRGLTGNGLAWDVANNLLWAGANETAVQIYLPTNAENPYRDTSGTAQFHHAGYFATNWFYGGLKEIYKDFESIYVAGENITSSRYVDVYWMDDDSTDWEYLGRVTGNRQELRWSDYATRPNSRQLKIALVLETDSYVQTPVVNAIRVKYQPMVMDRFRWSLPISISDYAEMTDNDRSPYTGAEMSAHLDSLITRVAPFVLEDVDELQYEVKVLSASENLQTYDVGEPTTSTVKLEKIQQLTLEQVTTGTYES